MTKTILAFGDSNTHGTPPMHNHDHHPRHDVPWPSALQKASGYTVINAGLPGRTACAKTTHDPELHLDGPLGLRIALLTHGPIDHLLLMLGTNDVQRKYGQSADGITAAMAGLIQIARDPDLQNKHGGFAMTLICPPPILEQGTFDPDLRGGAAKSKALAPLFRNLAADYAIDFCDAAQHIAVSPIDGVHFDAAAHKTLGQVLAATLMTSLE